MNGRKLRRHHLGELHIIKPRKHYVIRNTLSERIKRMFQVCGSGVVATYDCIRTMFLHIGADCWRVFGVCMQYI